jgi:tRNA uridine 5-carboxymethylaminomethyl modification enzyme
MADYDVIIIGSGHAGIEAALATARLGCKTLMFTFCIETIGTMSCNPAIGGVGKGQLVKEIDALGGEMAKAADECAIQFRILNSSKGIAVQSSRAQIDMRRYSRYMKELVLNQERITVIEAEVRNLVVRNNQVYGVVTEKKQEFLSECVIICAGTFLDGLVHVGLRHFSGGRINEPAAISLNEALKALGFNILRFKTGTCPRLDKESIDFSCLTEQKGDSIPKPFSFARKEIIKRQLSCFITHTNKDTHRIILDNLDSSPLYSGIIKATGVRYCPSIEDKVVKFKDKERHQIFLEPEGLGVAEIYPNGLSTSLPEEVQLKIIHSITGLGEAKVIRFGYGIEHSVVEPTQLYLTLETKSIKNLYLAGQINGTTGYEEAAAQGLISGINAALKIKRRQPLILDRSSSYIGVLIDDLVTKGTTEPYRMFTSRVEYRLLLREDNADLRLGKIGYDLGLIDREGYKRLEEKKMAIAKGIEFMRRTRIKPAQEINSLLGRLETPAIKRDTSLEEILKRPQVTIRDLKTLEGVYLEIPDFALPQVEIEVKYSGFIQRQLKNVERFKNLEKIKLPEGLDYSGIPSLSREIREKLNRFKPLNLGQASRISGVTPAAISLLMVYLRKLDGKK